MTSRARRTLKDAMNEALRDWVANVHDTFYIIGTAAGPHPYPELVRDFQSGDRHARRARRSCAGRGTVARSARRGGRRRLERDRAISSRSSDDSRRRRCSASRRRAHGLHSGRARRQPRPAVFPGILHGNRDLSAAGRGRPDRRGAFDLRGARLSRHRSRACLAAWRAVASNIRGHHRRRGARRLPAACCRAEGIIPALEPCACDRRAGRRRRAIMDRDQIILLEPLRAAATRTSTPSPMRWG